MRANPRGEARDTKTALNVIDIAHFIGHGSPTFKEWARVFYPNGNWGRSQLQQWNRFKQDIRRLGFASSTGKHGPGVRFHFDLNAAFAWAQSTLQEQASGGSFPSEPPQDYAVPYRRAGRHLGRPVEAAGSNPPSSKKCLAGSHDWSLTARACKRRGCGARLDEAGQGGLFGGAGAPGAPPIDPEVFRQGGLFGALEALPPPPRAKALPPEEAGQGSMFGNPRKKKPSDKLRDQEKPTVMGYELDPTTLLPVRHSVPTRPAGQDYGADPLGPDETGRFMFRMVPSGDIVDQVERAKRLKRDNPGGDETIRQLERQAVTGDVDALEKLLIESIRRQDVDTSFRVEDIAWRLSVPAYAVSMIGTSEPLPVLVQKRLFEIGMRSWEDRHKKPRARGPRYMLPLAGP